MIAFVRIESLCDTFHTFFRVHLIWFNENIEFACILMENTRVSTSTVILYVLILLDPSNKRLFAQIRVDFEALGGNTKEITRIPFVRIAH